MITIQWMPVFTEQLSYDPNITYFEPEPAFRYLTAQRDQTDYLRCPGLSNFLKNTFVIKSPYDFNIKVTNEWDVQTDRFGQAFFNENISVRNPQTHKDPLIIQTFPKYLFITEHKRPVTVSVIPWMFKANTYGIIPGSFDITQWIRPVNLAMEVYNPGIIEFKRGEVLYAVRFETEDTVRLDRGEFTEDIKQTMASCLNVQNYAPGMNLKSLYSSGQHYINLMKRKIFGGTRI